MLTMAWQAHDRVATQTEEKFVIAEIPFQVTPTEFFSASTADPSFGARVLICCHELSLGILMAHHYSAVQIKRYLHFQKIKERNSFK